MEGIRSPVRMVLEGLEGIVLLVLAVLTWPVARWFVNDCGSRPDEREREWPGDRMLARIDTRATRAVTIRAPAAQVWPWLLQFGLDRGGFHSYELLERLGGIDVRNVERIVPEFQRLEIDEETKLHPSAPGLWATLIEPSESLCYRSWKDEEELAVRDPAVVASFSLYLVVESDESCRFLVRTCKQVRRRRSLAVRLVAWLLEDPLDLIMERRMLRTVRRLAERDDSKHG
jgi:hypothetical protein